jgi:hypothetical protein
LDLHPGAAAAIARLSADELGIARMMASGDLVSPQFYHNLALYNMRVTGTGISYRGALDEFVYRRPENYLTSEFLARIGGLPVIWIHPKKNLLNSQEFGNRVVGAVMLPFIRDDEVWAVCRIYDDSAIAEMAAEQMSTSPAVLLDKSTKLTTESGERLLLEEKPALIDHLAIVSKGVWDKGQEASGVETEAIIIGDSSMAAEHEKEKDDSAKADAARADAEKQMHEKLDAMSKGVADAAKMMDACMKRMDAWEEKEKEREDKAKKDAAKADAEKEEHKDRKDGEEEKSDRKDAKKDGEKEEPEEEREKAKRLAADKSKKDAEEHERKDAARADAAVSGLEARLSAQQVMIDKLLASAPREISDAERAKFADIQSRADEALAMHGKRAKEQMLGETVIAYRRRMANELKKYSARWKDFPLEGIRDDAFEAQIEAQIYADAEIAARNPTDIAEGDLICRPRPTGPRQLHHINEYFGSPRAWMDPIAGPVRQYVRSFKQRED